MRESPPALPFLKWVGGKRQLLHAILAAAPREMRTYYEPFVGGAAVFFALSAERRFKQAVLADANDELIRCYQAVRDDVEAVIKQLKRHAYDRDHYYRVRELDPATLAPAARAARLIFLNKTGFNGLYRVNSKGGFNVPFGRYSNPLICDELNLRAVSAVLQRTELLCQDFAATVADATPADFVYLDPPYVPVSRTASFTAYAQGRFLADGQERLATLLRCLGERGVPALLSNSYCATTRNLYKGLPQQKIAARRAVNSDAGGRGDVSELLVQSFAYGAG